MYTEDFELESRKVEFGINPELMLIKLSESEKEEIFSDKPITLDFNLNITENIEQ
jgi:hypothetical protein